MKIKKTVYGIKNNRFKKDLHIALVSDLHGRDPRCVLEMLRAERPDYILMPGDIFEQLDGTDDRVFENGLMLLKGAAEICPSFYSAGNHEDGATRSWSMKWRKTVREREYDASDLKKIRETGVHVLSDGYGIFDGIAFGGILTGLIFEGREPKLDWLDEYCSLKEPKVLLCHHPEYYEKYLTGKNIDLIISGHAHGGQWRIFGRGVFAPGQGLFPKYTSGLHDGRFIISRGCSNNTRPIPVPRFFNPKEVLEIHIKSI